jgi:hypothetical protein
MKSWQVRVRVDGILHVLVITAHSAGAASGQLAAAEAAAKRNAGQRTVYDTRDGGRVEIDWNNAGSVAVVGPITLFDDLSRIAARRSAASAQQDDGSHGNAGA